MVEEAVAFCKRNMKVSTVIDPETGKRKDRTEYPLEAIREIILNNSKKVCGGIGRFPHTFYGDEISLSKCTTTISGRLLILMGIILFPRPLLTIIPVVPSTKIPASYFGKNP